MFQVPQAFAALMMLVVISLLLFHLIGLLQKICFPGACPGGALKPTTPSSQSG